MLMKFALEMFYNRGFFPHLFERVFLLIHFKEAVLVLHILYRDLRVRVIIVWSAALD